MSVTLDIPDDVLAAIPVPEAERGRYLLEEIACSLYARGVLSLGRAAEVAGISKIEFGIELGHRGIPRHYTQTELDADLAYARGV
jgi:predicted HTH domain antitoxin